MSSVVDISGGIIRYVCVVVIWCIIVIGSIRLYSFIYMISSCVGYIGVVSSISL